MTSIERCRGRFRACLPAIPRLFDVQISEAIYEQFPDPAARDTVIVATRRLAPST